jgi:hypothetical protein
MPPDWLDTLAALRAEQDQEEARLGEALGLDHGVPLDAVLVVSPDVGMRLTRDGRIPDRVRISWLLPPKTAYFVVASDLLR